MPYARAITRSSLWRTPNRLALIFTLRLPTLPILHRQLLTAVVVALLGLSGIPLLAASPFVQADSLRSIAVSKSVNATATSVAKVEQPIRLTVAYPGRPITSATVKLTTCKASPDAILADGKVHTVKASASCTIVVELPVGGHSGYAIVPGTPSSTLPSREYVPTCAAGTGPCPLYSRVIYEQFHVDFVTKCKTSCSGKPVPVPHNWIWCRPGFPVALNARPTSAHGFIDWTSSTKYITILSKNHSKTSAEVYGGGTVTANYG